MAISEKQVAYTDYLVDEEPKDDSAAGKKKKLTKAECKERKRREEIEFKKQEFYDQYQRELTLSKQSSIRGQENWKDMCRQIKLVQMKEELKSWEAKTNAILLRKDDKISLILEEIKETEEMHKRNFGIQLQIMDYLNDTLKTFHHVAILNYEMQAQEMIHDFFNESSARRQHDDDQQRNCENIMHATNLIMEKNLKEDFHIYIDRRDDLVISEIEKRYILRDAIMGKMKKLQNQLLSFLECIKTNTLDAKKYEHINTLMERQRTFFKESQNLNCAEVHYNHMYEDLENDFRLIELEDQRKIHDLKLEQKYFLDLRKNIEEQIRIDGEMTHEKLKVLTSECYGLCKNYEKLQEYGELLLTLSVNCRKLQTESEKIVPWGDFREPLNDESSAEEENFQLEILDLKSHLDLNEDELKAHMELMKNFWRRQALAEAQTILLEEKRRKLREENHHYIERIKSLSKANDVSELQEALYVKCVLEEKPKYPVMRHKCHN